MNAHIKATIRIATRKSPLALWQARHVAQQLKALHPGMEVELVPLSTQGDKLVDVPLGKVGGKGLFVKELEHALLDGRADIATHSMKDVPVELPPGLHLPVILLREDPRDALVALGARTLQALPAGARVGTCSLRRKCQLRAQWPNLEIHDLRGNVDTRLRKLHAGELDAIVLAVAGLRRLGLAERIAEVLSIDTIVPAIGQGAIGIECRAGDEAVERLIAPLNDQATALCVNAERAMNRTLGGGCQGPIAGYAEVRGEQLHLRGLVGHLDGSSILRAEGTAAATQPAELGRTVAKALLERGAGALLAHTHDHD